MSKKDKLRKNITQIASHSQKESIKESVQQLIIYDGGSTNKQKPIVVLKYFDPAIECLSEWTQEELKSLSNTLSQIQSKTWQGVWEDTGLDCKPVPKDNDQFSSLIKLIDEEINILQMRVGRKPRIYGFRVNQYFFLYRLDRNHSVFPE